MLEEEFPNARIICRTIDVTNAEAVQQGVQEVSRELGSVDIMLCFAGVVSRENAMDIEVDSWKRIMDINITGSWLCAQAAAK
jgi:sorbose reductase